MKAAISILCLSALLFTSCNDKEGDSTNEQLRTPNGPRKAGNHFILTTDLPPELIEGTPVPIRLPARTPGSRTPLAHAPTSHPPVLTLTDPSAKPAPQPAPRSARQEDRAYPAPMDPAGPAVNRGAWNRHAPSVDHERYGQLADNAWQTPMDAPLSTFSIDVDTASYSNLRRMIPGGTPIRQDTVRLEEMVNYFD